MQTDAHRTGNIYSTIEAYCKNAPVCQQYPNPDTWYYFATTQQFKTCKGFVEYLKARHPAVQFKAQRTH